MGGSRGEADVTSLLERVQRGDPAAEGLLFELVHQNLHRQARRAMGGQAAEHTLQATALVNEAYLRLMGGAPQDWRDREHFLATAARAMRQVLVDHARGKRRLCRDGGARVLLEEAAAVYEGRDLDLLVLDEVLTRFEAFDPEMARAVQLRLFAGLSREETAATLGLAPRTFDRRWRAARAWLTSEMR